MASESKKSKFLWLVFSAIVTGIIAIWLQGVFKEPEDHVLHSDAFYSQLGDGKVNKFDRFLVFFVNQGSKPITDLEVTFEEFYIHQVQARGSDVCEYLGVVGYEMSWKCHLINPGECIAILLNYPVKASRGEYLKMRARAFGVTLSDRFDITAKLENQRMYVGGPCRGFM